MQALKDRIRQIEDAHKAIPETAIKIANKVRSDVNDSRRVIGKRRREAKAAGAAVPTKRGGSGIPIDVTVENKSAFVSASGQVHHIAHEQSEPDEWMDIFAAGITRAAGGKL